MNIPLTNTGWIGDRSTRRHSEESNLTTFLCAVAILLVLAV
ncbi:MAG: hypothetical protein ACXW2A_15360 [Burkholderiales bacterium]|jgi:hypothetical protein